MWLQQLVFRQLLAGGRAGPPGPMPTGHPLLQPRQLTIDAEAGAAAVAALLRPPATEELPGTLRVVAAKMAGRLAQERPRLVGRLLPPLLALAKRTAAQVQVPAGAPAQPWPLVSAVTELPRVIAASCKAPSCRHFVYPGTASCRSACCAQKMFMYCFKCETAFCFNKTRKPSIKTSW